MTSFSARCKKDFVTNLGNEVFSVGCYYPAIEHYTRSGERWYRVYYGEHHSAYFGFAIDLPSELPRLYEYFCTEAEERKAKIQVVMDDK
jgi:hypothetical protein